ncbi:LysR family transcriptional regulator [Vibrio sinaloensis]|uniref:LysR family transcriptional regulator n=1 Tax=Photobacterium sp. (strain ATCC 43367) TaxID=379097 RepID=UPI002048D068|nr:LysR family transcriptional regulator [Vibrio sinaloensis]UPQ90256.1 LysR family transcriptional regulator [Vibrio sinaloensis]
MPVSIEQLESFVATADKGSFRAAAASLGKHASTISVAVANLEIDLGVDLFNRTAKSLQITSQGQDLYQYAKMVLAERDHLEAKADSLLRGEPQKLTIAIDEALCIPEVVQACAEVLNHQPQISLNIMYGDPNQVVAWLLANRADIGLRLSAASLAHGLSMDDAFSFEGVRVTNGRQKMADGAISQLQLRQMRQIALSYVRDEKIGQLHSQSNHVIYANSVGGVVKMVAAGMGWAILPRFSCRDALERGEVQEFYCEDEANLKWHTELLWPTDKPLNSAMKVFKDEIIAIPDM